VSRLHENGGIPPKPATITKHCTGVHITGTFFGLIKEKINEDARNE
jgi:hypothetical protein